ncbi:hypothetical protein Cni_G16360 [Canna indica]|uniref:Uncharacterized protein n=1 Tax=Canna indica TaxID=4628 RepID=A0AAQ3KF64_9LILI|nr:hypothetical protein Cni_G16360 [Canna indica]
MHSCSNPLGFSRPLPLVGLYAAGASTLCALLMAYDAITAIHLRHFWFPSTAFPLNALTITLIAISVKIPLDLKSAMPSHLDQLAKLSGPALVAIASANMHPSLSSVHNTSATKSNLAALALTVLTIVVDVSLQISTGVIYAFVAEQIAIMFLTVSIFVVLCSSALAVPTTKKKLERKSDERSAEIYVGDDIFSVDSLNEYVKCNWMMAHTSRPQYVLGRSVASTASGAFALFTFFILAQATARSFIKYSGHGMRFCGGQSDYKWSIKVVFVSQAIAASVGTIGPSCRWFNAVVFRGACKCGLCINTTTCQGELQGTCLGEFKTESYWLEMITERKKNATFLFLFDSYPWSRKIIQKLNTVVLDFLAVVQTLVVVGCKVVHLTSVWLVLLFRRIWRWVFASIPSSSGCATGNYTAASNTQQQAMMDATPSNSTPPWKDPSCRTATSSKMENFVLCLDGEDNHSSKKFLIHMEGNDSDLWIQKGWRNKPNHLIKLMGLDRCDLFQHVHAFDNGGTSKLISVEPPNCWVLPLVTLTSIVIALPSVKFKPIRRGVRQGLKYVRLVERFMDGQGLVGMRKAADTLWLEVDLYNRWLGKNLRRLDVSRKESGARVIQRLRDISKDNLLRLFGQDGGQTQKRMSNWREWPAEAYVSNCMYRVTETLLQKYNGKATTTDCELFDWLKTRIADILCACLTNLPGIIDRQCVCTTIENQAKGVRKAALLLGETQDILRKLGAPKLIEFYPANRQYIDSWSKAMPSDYFEEQFALTIEGEKRCKQ